MARAIGIVISEDTPEVTNMDAWFKPSTQQWYEVVNGAWSVSADIPEYAPVAHTHDGLDELGDIVTLLGNGVTGTKTVGNYTLTFNHGVLVGFEVN
jgi:hypothetical protein